MNPLSERKSLLLLTLLVAVLVGAISIGAHSARNATPTPAFTDFGNGRITIEISPYTLRLQRQTDSKPASATVLTDYSGSQAEDLFLIHAAHRLLTRRSFASRMDISDEQLDRIKALRLPAPPRTLNPDDDKRLAGALDAYLAATGPAKSDARAKLIDLAREICGPVPSPAQFTRHAAELRKILTPEQTARLLAALPIT